MAYLHKESVTVLLPTGSEELPAGGLNWQMLGSDPILLFSNFFRSAKRPLEKPPE